MYRLAIGLQSESIAIDSYILSSVEYKCSAALSQGFWFFLL